MAKRFLRTTFILQRAITHPLGTCVHETLYKKKILEKGVCMPQDVSLDVVCKNGVSFSEHILILLSPLLYMFEINR